MQTSMDCLNEDVVYLICTYLNLEALTNLSIACPELSYDILRYLRRKRWAMKMKIRQRNITLEYISVTKATPGIKLPEEKPVQDDLLPGQWELIREVKNQIPYEALDFVYVDITQFGSTPVPPDVKDILGAIRTDLLVFKYENRCDAKNILERISFNPGATLYIHELTFKKATEPLIPTKMTGVKDVWFSGDILPADLATVLSSESVSVCLSCDRIRKDCMVMVREYIKDFLDGRANQTSCKISSSGERLRRVFEDVAGVGEDNISNGQRHVHCISALEETPIHCFIDAINSVNTCT